MSEQKTCFVIGPIGQPDSPTRKRSDQILKHIITPALEACGYKPERADQIEKPGIITNQVIQHVANDPLVIADLTGHNPNVFYELAVRHAVRKPLIHMIQQGEDIPFDVSQSRTIYVDHTDLDVAARAKKELTAQIKALGGDPSATDNPISVAIDLHTLRQSDNPEERSIAELATTVAELRTIALDTEGILLAFMSWKGYSPALSERVLIRRLGGTASAADASMDSA